MMFRWTEEQRIAHQRKIHGNDKNHSAGQVSDMERPASDAAQAANESKEALSRPVIRFTHYRRKLADPDGHCTKYFVDALVKNGLLPDDSAKEVEEVRHRQVKIENWEEERTVIELIDSQLMREAEQ